MKIAVLGAGSWGVAISSLLSENKHDILLWHYNDKLIKLLKIDRTHPKFPKYSLNSNIDFTSNYKDISSCNYVICCIPSNYLTEHLPRFKFSDNYFINCTKGFSEKGSLLSNLIHDMTSINTSNICILSGPNHAEEVIGRMPTATVIASLNRKLVLDVQKIFSNEYFRVYTSGDIYGVQVGGCAKNIIAIAAGICYGLKIGDNILAALVSRSLEEIKRLGAYFNANRSTFNGLSGLGDLIVTSFSNHSRNRKVGIDLSHGKVINELKNKDSIAEGIIATKIVYKIAKDNNIDMPICNQVYDILYNGKNPKEGITDLMSRKLISEISS